VQYPKFAHNQNLTKTREAASKRPAPPPDYSPTIQRSLTESSVSPQPEVKLREVKLREENLKAIAFTAGKADDAPPGENSLQKLKPKDLVDLWNSLGCKPMVSELTDERRKKAELRIRKRSDFRWWQGLFEKVQVLNKLWLTFDFLIRNDTHSLRVLEGNYDQSFENRGDGRGQRPGPGKYENRQGRQVVDLDSPASG